MPVSPRYRELILVSLIFLFLTVVMTWPFIVHLNDSVVGSVGDNWYYVWLIKWFEKSLIELNGNPFFVPTHNTPYGWYLAYTEISLSNIIFALPISILGGPVLAYNGILILSFILSALFTYSWVKRLTGNSFAALISGALFAFSPYRLAHLNGHWPLMGTHWLVLHFMFLYLCLHQESINKKYAFLSGLGLGMASLSSMYYLYMTLVISSFYILGYILFILRSVKESFLVKKVAFILLYSSPLLILSILPYFFLAYAGIHNHHTLSVVDRFSASLNDYFLPAPIHFLWGHFIGTNYDRSLWIEQTIYPGLVVILFCFLTLIIKNYLSTSKPLIHFLLFVISIAVILSMGTSYHWNNHSVIISMPSAIWDHLKGYLTTGSFLGNLVSFERGLAIIPLPGYFLFKWLPFYDSMRVWMRYGVFVNLFAVIVTGIGISYLLNRLSKKLGYVLTILLLLLVFLDFYSLQMFSKVDFSPVDRWLSGQREKSTYAYFPSHRLYSPEVLYGTSLHNHPFVGMFYGAHFPPEFQHDLRLLNKFPKSPSLAALGKRRVKYVVVDSLSYPNWAEFHQEIISSGFKLIIVIKDQFIYETPLES